MDVTTIAGLVGAIGLILLGQALKGGHVGSILQGTAALIVFGGTAGAVTVAFPKKQSVQGMKTIKRAFTGGKADLAGLPKQIVGFASVARRDGVLALEG